VERAGGADKGDKGHATRAAELMKQLGRPDEK